jgi:hypothetical protein
VLIDGFALGFGSLIPLGLRLPAMGLCALARFRLAVLSEGGGGDGCQQQGGGQGEDTGLHDQT